MKDQLPGLTHKVISEHVILVLNIRERKTRYVGLICQIPFSYGYMLCPFVRKRLHFNINVKIFPRHFRTTERAWNWCSKWASGWKPKPRYTIFNPLIGWLGVYGQVLYTIATDTKLHLSITQLVMSLICVLLGVSSNRTSVELKRCFCVVMDEYSQDLRNNLVFDYCQFLLAHFTHFTQIYKNRKDRDTFLRIYFSQRR